MTKNKSKQVASTNNLSKTNKTNKTNNPNNQRPGRGIGIALIIIAVVFGIGILSFALFTSAALYMGLITGDQYVQIATKFFEVVESGTSIIPSIIPTR
ncbi:hypothetical protein [Bacillus sp. PK30]|uniref:hypothetical protein n=1 Tax=Bacillus sp. PK30 TaxID=2954724 RepID=UPI0030F7E5F1